MALRGDEPISRTTSSASIHLRKASICVQKKKRSVLPPVRRHVKPSPWQSCDEAGVNFAPSRGREDKLTKTGGAAMYEYDHPASKKPWPDIDRAWAEFNDAPGPVCSYSSTCKTASAWHASHEYLG